LRDSGNLHAGQALTIPATVGDAISVRKCARICGVERDSFEIGKWALGRYLQAAATASDTIFR